MRMFCSENPSAITRVLWRTPVAVLLLVHALPGASHGKPVPEGGPTSPQLTGRIFNGVGDARPDPTQPAHLYSAALTGPLPVIAAGLFLTGLAYSLWRRWFRARLLAKAVTVALQSRDEHARRMALIANRTKNALIVTAPDGCIEWVNAGFTWMTGYAASEALGKRLTDVLLPAASDKAAVAQLRVEVLERETAKLELEARNKSGETYCVALEVQPMGDEGGGYVAVATDITRRVLAEQELRRAHDELERRVEDRTRALATANQALEAEAADRMRAEAALRLEERKTRQIVETALDAVVIADAAGAITGWNGQAERMFGWTAAEAVGRPLHELIIPQRFREAHLHGIARARETGEGQVLNRRVEVTALHRDGREFPVELSIAPLKVDDTYVFSAFARDITGRKRAEEELAAAKSAAEAANAAKSDFLANMSHEIRTPMTAIIGHADLLLDPDVSPSDRLDSVNAVRRSGEHLLTVINDILDLSKIEAGKMTVERVECDPCRVAGEVASLLRSRAQEKGLTFDLTFLTPLPRTIESDPTRLRQILFNLIGNAVKFTGDGAVRVVVRLEDRVEDCPLLCFDVTDTGIGMSDEQLRRLFHAFAQADGSTTRQFGGTGLGLVICRRLARLLDGDILVKSRTGDGSRFTVAVPAGDLRVREMILDPAEAVRLADGPAAEKPAAAEAPGPLPGRVLLAEDGRENQIILAAYLRKAGLEVAIAHDGRQAVELVRSRPFDLVLMDMQMPHLDGYGAASALRREGFTLPIVALTAHAMSEDRDKCINAGCTDYLSKPVSRHDLLETVRRHLLAPTPGAAPAPTGAAAPPAGVLRSELAEDPEIAQFLPEFLAALPEKVTALASLRRRSDLDDLKDAVHQLKGCGGMYGFPQITETAAEAERRIMEQEPLEAVRQSVEELVRLVRSVEGYDPAREIRPGIKKGDA